MDAKNAADDIVQVNFSLQMPDNRPIRKLTLRFPSVTCSILSLLPINLEKGMSIMQITGEESNQLVEELIKVMPASSHQYFSDKNRTHLISLESTDPWILHQMILLEVALRYPILIRKGIMHMELIAPRNKIDMLLTKFEQKSFHFQLNRIGRVQMEPLLTRNQETTLQKAKELGYFEIPRRINLHALADSFHISASALSEKLRRIMAKLSQEYLNQL